MNYGMVIRGVMKMGIPWPPTARSVDILSDTEFRDAYLLYRRNNMPPLSYPSAPAVGQQMRATVRQGLFWELGV